MRRGSANLAGCGYNKLQNQDEAVKAAWSEVVNQYQRRADLIPNLVATVKGFAAQEERVLVGVTEARAKATSIQLTPELINDPEAFAKFQAAQGELTQALKSLIAVDARTIPSSSPTPTSATCRRSSRARRTASPWRATATSRRCRPYNVTVREFPTNLTANMFDFEVKPNFTVRERGARSPRRPP